MMQSSSIISSLNTKYFSPKTKHLSISNLEIYRWMDTRSKSLCQNCFILAPAAISLTILAFKLIQGKLFKNSDVLLSCYLVFLRLLSLTVITSVIEMAPSKARRTGELKFAPLTEVDYGYRTKFYTV
jgi:hypothetical protein